MTEETALRFIPEAALPLYRLLLEEGDTPREAVINALNTMQIIVVRSVKAAARKRPQKGKGCD